MGPEVECMLHSATVFSASTGTSQYVHVSRVGTLFMQFTAILQCIFILTNPVVPISHRPARALVFGTITPPLSCRDTKFPTI